MAQTETALGNPPFAPPHRPRHARVHLCGDARRARRGDARARARRAGGGGGGGGGAVGPGCAAGTSGGVFERIGRIERIGVRGAGAVPDRAGRRARRPGDGGDRDGGPARRREAPGRVPGGRLAQTHGRRRSRRRSPCRPRGRHCRPNFAGGDIGVSGDIASGRRSGRRRRRRRGDIRRRRRGGRRRRRGERRVVFGELPLSAPADGGEGYAGGGALDGRRAYAFNVCVAPHARRRGVARRLLAAAHASAARGGASTCTATWSAPTPRRGGCTRASGTSRRRRRATGSRGNWGGRRACSCVRASRETRRRPTRRDRQRANARVCLVRLVSRSVNNRTIFFY